MYYAADEYYLEPDEDCELPFMDFEDESELDDENDEE